MNATYDRNIHRERAMSLFLVEEREQQIAATALRQAAAQGIVGTHNNATAAFGLEGIVHAAEKNILNAHRELQTARDFAASMSASDPELARLHALVDGISPVTAAPQGKVIEGEATEIFAQSNEHPPHAE